MTLIDALLDEIKNLKPIPAIASQLLALVDDPESSMEDIANVIQYDPLITASVIKICNTAFFGLKSPVESVKDAVNLLGTDQIVELVLIKSGADSLSGSQDGYGLESGDIWRYSVASAIIAKQVAVRLKLDYKNTIFTSALIKDIGKVILEKYVARSSDKIDHLVRHGGMSFREAEKKILGIDHAELGAMIAKMWNFSPRMISIIRHHHLSDESMMKDKAIAAVYLADCICMMLGIGVGSDGLAYRFKEDVMAELGISPDDIAMIIAEFGISIQEIEGLLNIVRN